MKLSGIIAVFSSLLLIAACVPLKDSDVPKDGEEAAQKNASEEVVPYKLFAITEVLDIIWQGPGKYSEPKPKCKKQLRIFPKVAPIRNIFTVYWLSSQKITDRIRI